MSTRTDWRTRLAAVVIFADHLLLQADTLISACLDTRPVRSWGADLAAWLGSTWRAHLAAAHTRRHGPGRGVIAVVINRPNTAERSTRER